MKKVIPKTPNTHKVCVVYTPTGKVKFTNVDKVIVAMRDGAKVQHQASLDVTLENINRLKKRAAAVGGQLVWEFPQVRVADPNGSLFIRFKCNTAVNPPDEHIYSEWLVGDYRQVRDGAPADTEPEQFHGHALESHPEKALCIWPKFRFLSNPVFCVQW